MSTYEKIASALLVILVVVVAVLWFGRHPQSDFDESQGQDFRIGPFDTIASTTTSGIAEQHCSQLEPVVIAALHDLDERLASQAAPLGHWDDFEVNAQTLATLCDTQATIELRDKGGDQLFITKAPFSRAVPPGGTPADIGTVVSLSAIIETAGSTTTPPAAQASTYLLIPDRVLDSDQTD